MVDHDVPGQCREKGIILKDSLIKLKEKYPTLINDVRGIGLMLAVEFDNSEIGYSVAKGLFARGVMTAGTLVNAKCIRFEPAAVITEEEIAKVMERMDAALADTKELFHK
jgi:putrescine aminotransferase